VCYQGRKNFGPLLHGIQDYKAAFLPPFSKSDHGTIFLLPEYKQRIVGEAVATRYVNRWSDQNEAYLQDARSDWDVFLSSSSDVREFTDVVTNFIATLADTTFPTFGDDSPTVHSLVSYGLSHSELILCSVRGQQQHC